MSAAIDINSMPVRFRYLDPDEPDPVLQQEAREAAQEDYIDMWAEDELVPDAVDSALQALIDQESGLFQQFIADYRHGDAAEFDQRAGELARALERHVKAQA